DSFFLTSVPNNQAVYLIKLNKFNQLIWAKSFGSGVGLDITIDYDGLIDVVGVFTGSSDFDPGVGITTLTSHGAEDIFICQFSGNGTFQWAQGFGGPETDHVSSITVDTSNNIYTTGYFRNTLDIDPGIPVVTMTAAGETDAFIQKLSQSGIHIWSRQYGDSLFDNGTAVRFAKNGNIILTGTFQGMVDFDPGSGVHTLINDDSLDVFVSSLNQGGFYEWAKNFGGVDDVIASDVVLDQQDNILITGTFENVADFNPEILQYAHLTSLGGKDIFLNKLDVNGNFIWVKQMGGAGLNDNVEAITLDDEGKIYLTGNFTTVCDVDPGPEIYNLVSPSSADMFLVKLDVTAHLLSAHQLGGPSNDQAHDVAVDKDHKAFVTGAFSDSTDFSPGRETSFVQSKGGQDAFIVRLNFLPYISDLRGPVAPCATHPTTYSINAENVTQFTWTFPGSWTVIGNSNNDTVTVVPTAVGGSLSVIATGENGTTFPLTLSVDPVTDPVLSNLSGTFIVCPGEIKTYRVVGIDLDSIAWSFPAGWQIIGNAHTDSVKVKAGTNNGVLQVTGFNACGDTSLQRNLFTKNLPVISNLIGDLTPCIGDTLIYRVQQSAVNHYDWTFPTGWSILSNEDSIAIRVSIGAQAGQVVVKGTNDCGDTNYISAINPIAVPNATISVNNNILTINPPGQTYQWYLNAVPLTGAVQNPYTATQNGMYYAKVTYSTGCIAYTDVVNVVISGLEYFALDKVHVFPIPAKEEIHIKGFDPEFDFKIYDLTGRLLMQGQCISNAISIAQLMEGSYFLRIENENRFFTFLFIKEY
ncbi:MAG TPA: SBBP repeat-containing protein, partial [Saprospiraceae bacterium]|nr:SBBP repeat-containing protein [Saprospiraceae bacterium]